MSRQMKESGVLWIGEMPKDWSLRRLRYLCSISKGNQDTQDNDPEGEYPFYVRSPIVEHSRKWTFEGPSILMAGDGAGAGKVFHYVDGKYGCHQRVYSMQNFVDANRRFVYYFMQNRFWVAIDLANSKSTVDSVRLPMLQDFWIPLPDINEQQKIADFLDMKCSHIDSVLEQTRVSIDEYKKLKQAAVTQAVIKGVRGDRAMKDSEVEWLGNIPVDWNVYRIANLYDERSESGLEELPILTVSINTGVSDHEIADEDKDRVFVRSEDRTKYKRVYPGDLAYNMMRAWQGAFGAVRVDGMVSPAYVVAKPKKNVKLDSRYMEALLRTSEATEEMHRFSRGIVDFRLRLYWPEFKNIRICLPPIAEQIEIADYIDEKSAAIDALIAKKEAFAAELENYKKSMIYEYVTGKKEVPQS